MIHIVFQQSDVTTLQKAIELDETLQGEIFLIRDDFAVGPLASIDTDEGWNNRKNWWISLLSQTPYSVEIVNEFDDRKTVEDVKLLLQQDNSYELWIWMGQNQHDVCGYYWLISSLKSYQGQIIVLYLNNLPFINEKGQIFYPTTLHEIQPKEFLKAKKLNRKVTLSEFEVDPDEWNRLVNENAMIRILEGGKKIVGKDESYYDQDILNGLSTEWQKGNKAISHILGKMKIKTGDVFLLSRIKHLASENKIEITGDPVNGWKEFEIRLKSNVPETVTSEVNS
jgi:hypothetical protein